MYTDADSVYRVAGITSSEISEANVNEFIKDAEVEVDRIIHSTVWAVEDSGTASSGTTLTLTDSTQAWTVNDYNSQSYLWITGGTGVNEMQKIASNTATELTVDTAFTVALDDTSTYRIIHCGHDPRKNEEDATGKNTAKLYLLKYPVRRLNTVTVLDVSITTSYIDVMDNQLYLTSDAEKTMWTSQRDPGNDINYWFGVYPIEREIQSLTAVVAALNALYAQMGGTHNIPSTYSLPEGSVTIGQAYINIKGTTDVLIKKRNDLIKRIRKYPVVII